MLLLGATVYNNKYYLMLQSVHPAKFCLNISYPLIPNNAKIVVKVAKFSEYHRF